jgi:hypothetical protein
MLAVLMEVPKTQLDWDRWGFHNQDQIRITRNAVQTLKNITLAEYPVYPVRLENFNEFLLNNCSAHRDLTTVMNVQADDISSVNPENEEALKIWIWHNYNELRVLADRLGI